MAWRITKPSDKAAVVLGGALGIVGTAHGLATHYHTKGPPPEEFYSSSCLDNNGKTAATCTKIWREGSGRDGQHSTWKNPNASGGEKLDNYAQWYADHPEGK